MECALYVWGLRNSRGCVCLLLTLFFFISFIFSFDIIRLICCTGFSQKLSIDRQTPWKKQWNEKKYEYIFTRKRLDDIIYFSGADLPLTIPFNTFFYFTLYSPFFRVYVCVCVYKGSQFQWKELRIMLLIIIIIICVMELCAWFPFHIYHHRCRCCRVIGCRQSQFAMRNSHCVTAIPAIGEYNWNQSWVK